MLDKFMRKYSKSAKIFMRQGCFQLIWCNQYTRGGELLVSLLPLDLMMHDVFFPVYGLNASDERAENVVTHNFISPSCNH